MSVFPKLGILDKSIVETMEHRAGNNLAISKLIPWIRISSAVDGGLVMESIPKSSNFKELYGTKTQSGRVGLNFNDEPVTAAGPERGFRPSPIIESISIENGHSGLSRKAKFSIKCYTLGQAEIISKHFLEPGYTVLVEYGWNLKESLDRKDKVSACYIASFNNYNFITKKRTSSKGTYDGFMGFITGGGYASGDDETYIIDVELTTLGEIPSYLQIHKVAINSDESDSNEENTSGKYDISEIESNLDGGNDTIGYGLFKMVYNQLPNEKRTRQVKSLISGNDIYGNPLASQFNFINVDETTREKFMNNFDSFLVNNYNSGGEYEVSIPNGLNLISNQSFIRMELAFKILNAYGINTKPTINAKKCSGEDSTPSYNFQIEMNNTIIRAHKHIFSTDITKLFIPNSNLPTFALNSVLSATEEVDIDKLIDIKDPKIIDGNQWTDSGYVDAKKYAFPSNTDLSEEPLDSLQGVHTPDARGQTWGYLRNLYINLDFFLEVLNRTNYVAKDCYYELLNGISSSCNSFWKFELMERPSTITINGSKYDTYQMEVVDQNFTGDISIPNIKDTIPVFEPNGVRSPFLSSNILMDIPAVMKNSILGKRSSAKIETSIEEKEVERTRFFSDKPDPVMVILDSFKKIDDSDEKLPGSESIKENDIDTNRKHNLELFTKKGTLVITIRDRKKLSGNWFKKFFGSAGSGKLGNNVLIAAFNDNILLKKLEREFNKTLSKDTGKNINNPSILAIEFQFETHGISGIKIGDVFKVNRLPKNYSTGIFQVMETSHELSNGQWRTTVSAKLRNV